MIRRPIESKVTEYLHRKAARTGTPLCGTFELTPLCNMNCRMCYVRLSKEQQEKISPLHMAEEWIRVADEAKKEGMLYLLLTGGEPFLYPDFQKLLETLHRMGFLITINSNATMINEETIDWLKKCPPVRMNITLYGASDRTYERLCRNPKGFTQASHAIELLQDAGIQVRVNCSVTPHNLKDLPGIIQFCNDHKLIFAPATYMFPPLRKDESMVGRNDRFTPQEAAEVQAGIEYMLTGPELFLEKIRKNNMTGLVTDVEEDCINSEGEGLSCRSGKCAFWVTWYGRMIPCGMMPLTEPYKNIFEDSFVNCWNQVKEEVRKIRLPAKCASCHLKELCRPCGAMTYTETGHFYEIPDYRCEMAHAYPKACLKISREIEETGGSDETQKKC